MSRKRKKGVEPEVIIPRSPEALAAKLRRGGGPHDSRPRGQRARCDERRAAIRASLREQG